jgi:hypothetical protein
MLGKCSTTEYIPSPYFPLFHSFECYHECLVASLDYSLLVYRKTNDFSMLISHCVVTAACLL